jgi:putative transposase
VGKKSGPNPTDRAKSGTKRSILTEGGGIPVGVAVAGANRPDYQLVRETLESIPVARPTPTPAAPQGLCLDQGYDHAEVYELVAEFGYTAHIRPWGSGEEAVDPTTGEVVEKKARRWVVERTHSWLNRFRRLLIRWEKKSESYLAMLHFACALITWRSALSG